ncbi:MAG TPA: SRPBCC domain-containing protein [Caulobacterales bacterium]|nr:SRPBCC domain-containing protein [Caulobacterales bacterium]
MTTIQMQRREVVLTRTLNAPRELVWQAWTEPKRMAVWWGPHGFTTPVCEADVRKGGALRIVMRPDEEMRVAMGLPPGAEFRMGGVFEEVIRPERLAFTNNAFDMEGNQQLAGYTTVTLDDLGGKTRITVTTSAEGEGPVAAGMLAGMEEGWSQMLERLSAYAAGAQA